MECRPGAQSPFGDYQAIVILYDLLADGETNTGARIVFARVKALEHVEYSLTVFRRKADAVVGNRDVMIFIRPFFH